MTRNYLPYVQKMFHSAMKEILMDIAKNGLTEQPHYYLITFRTNHKDVKIPEFIRTIYPEEIDIDLQEHIHDLVVSETSFSIILTVNGVSSTITVPFEALNGFRGGSFFWYLGENDMTFVPKEEKGIPLNTPNQPGKIIDLTSFRNKK